MVEHSYSANRQPLLLPGLIGFVFAFRACLTVLWFQQDPQQATALSAALSLFLLACAAFSTMGAESPGLSSPSKTPAIRWLAALPGLALITILWTAAPKGAALGYWSAWAADIGAVWFVMRKGDVEHTSEVIMKGFISGAVIVATVAWILPPADDMRLGDIDFLHPNAIGFLFAISTFFAIHLTRKNRLWMIPALFLATTLLRTISKTSIISFVIAFSVWVLMDATLSRSARIKIGAAAGIIVASLWSVLGVYLDRYTEGNGPETLTGRTLIWAVSFEYAIKKPWLGNGFYAYRYVVPAFGEFEAWQAHNELLQQFFSFGIAGVLVVILLYWTFFRQIRRAPASGIKTLSAALLVFALVHGLTDTENFDISCPLWLMTMLSVLLTVQSSIPSPAEITSVSDESASPLMPGTPPIQEQPVV